MNKDKVLYKFYMNIDFILSYFLAFIAIFFAFIFVFSPDPDAFFISIGISFVGIMWIILSVRLSCIVELYDRHLIKRNFIIQTSIIIPYENIQKIIIKRSIFSKAVHDFVEIKIVSNLKEHMIFVQGLRTPLKTKLRIYQELRRGIGNRWDDIYTDYE